MHKTRQLWTDSLEMMDGKIFIISIKSARGYHRPLINHYKSKLKKLGYAEVKDDEEIWTEPLMRNQKNAPLYRLLFASKSELGVKFWKDITKIKRSGQMQLL